LKKTILIVDDEKNTREGLRTSLEDDYEVYVAADAAGAKAIMETDRVDLLLTDLRLGADNGMDLLQWALRQNHAPVCIMMTAYGGIEDAVAAMKTGAYDFVTKPVNIDRLDLLIKRSLHGSELERENVRLREQIDKRYGLENFVGDSPAMAHVLDTIKQVAPSRATVLITGESGTGKELAAHAIHRLSPRHRGPFVAVHCAALSPQLLESELFGHEKGAFTGAGERRIGRFEQAAGGTLFLDDSPRPTATWPKWSRRANSARTSSSASTSCNFTCRRFATGARTSRCSPCTSCARRRRTTTNPSAN
jgi:DNA-binding NtrC family response regulator